MTAINIVCRPGAGILDVSVDTIAAIDALAEQLRDRIAGLAATVPADTPWQVDFAIGRTAADTIHITATPTTDEDADADA